VNVAVCCVPEFVSFFYKSWWSVKFIYQLALVEILRRVLRDFLGTCKISQDPAQDPAQDPTQDPRRQ